MASVISSSPRQEGLDAVDRLEDVVVEHIDADQRQVAGRLLGFFDQADDAPIVVQLGHAVLLRLLDPGQHDLAVPVAVGELGDQGLMPPWITLSPRNITKRSSPRKSLRDLDRVGQPQRRILRDVGDVDAPALAPPTASLISSAVSPTTMPISVMPASRMASITRKSTGLLATGINCLALV